LHSQRAHAEYLHSLGAEFVLTVKGNQPRLFAALDALPWAQTPIAARDIDTNHSRVTTRTIQVLPAPTGLPFPHVNQVWLIERYVTDPDGTPRSAIAALGVTSLPTTRATPTDIATLVREHWGIESLHWLRDTVYREDNSTARTGSGPRVMAALVTSRSAPSTCSADATSPRPPNGQPASWTDPSRSSTSRHDLGTTLVTDQLASYGVAHRRLIPSVEHRRSKYLNNRAENSHQPTRQRERAMKRFRSAGGAQRFLSAFSGISPHFRTRRHLLHAQEYRREMANRFSIWNEVTGLTTAA
jgi:DDE domain/Transposase DDE domain